jgi:pilus assembly protein CpaE
MSGIAGQRGEAERAAVARGRAPSRRRRGGGRDRQRGQAALELLALLPLLLAVALAATQLLAVGYASVLAGNAAEAAALALAGGGDPRAAAHEALPSWSRTRARLSVTGGHVQVRLRPPTLLRVLTGRLEVSANAAVEAP